MSNPLIQIQLKPKDGAKAGAGANSALDFEALRARMAGAKGRQYWRSLEELADAPEFQNYMEREFPHQAPRDMTPLSRRDFMKFMGASLALAGVGGCAFQPQEKIVPYVKTPDDLIPGIPQFYATAYTHGGYAYGLLAESNMGRPTKIEGNPDHPDSLGATNVWAQASVLNLYDPDRSASVLKLGEAATYDQFLGEITGRIEGTNLSNASGMDNNGPDAANTDASNGGGGLRVQRGQGLRILTETVTSPTLLGQIAAMKRAFPQAKWHQYEPVNNDNVHAGAQLAFGTDAHAVYHFDQADVILSLDSNFLYEEPGHLRHARAFSSKRRIRAASKDAPMNRLYMAESTPTITGIKADHKMPMRAGDVETFAREIARRLGVGGLTSGAAVAGVDEKHLNALVADLQASKGRGLVVAGYHQSPAVHALAHAMNAVLGNAGKTVTYHQAVEGDTSGQMNSLRTLVTDMKAGRVSTLVILGGNPVYTAPVDLDFAGAMDKVPLRVHLSPYEDETSAVCHWHLPETHYLEAWGDARASDGTTTIIQPLVEPLYPATRSQIEVLANFTDRPERAGYDVLRSHYLNQSGAASGDSMGSGATSRNGMGGPVGSGGSESGQRRMGEQDSGKQGQSTNGQQGSGQVSIGGGGGSSAGGGSAGVAGGQGNREFEKKWQTNLHTGIVPGSQSPRKNVTARTTLALPAQAAANGLEINFRPDPNIWDGRFSNNGWLQELPKPLSKLTWDNALLVGPTTATERQLGTGDMVTLSLGGREVKAAVHVVPGQAPNSATLHLGYGRPRSGRIGTSSEDNPVGFNAGALRTSTAPYFASGLDIKPAGGSYRLARTDHYNLIDTRESGKPSTTRKLDAMVSKETQEVAVDGTHGRELILGGTISQFRKNPGFAVSDENKEGLPQMPSYESANQYGVYEFQGKNREGTKDIHRPAAKTDDAGGREAAGNIEGGRAVKKESTEGHDEANEGQRETQPSLYPREIDQERRYRDETNNEGPTEDEASRPYAWGMSVDLNACIGCNACVVGCQSENNTATVGKDQVMIGRNLHWLRIDTYYRGSLDNPEATFQPVMCMHCEKAPCEPVCPVNAAVHSYEGINEQVYNRCIGTRYCANNCPYKVRRFNYLQYSEQDSPTIMLMHNPEVTVRARGVMEKCNYCIQRVNAGKFQAEKEDRQVKDGEILTACQQACPTNAIVFGNINDPTSQVRKLKEEPHDYGLLTELNVYPRTTYLAKIVNPNPAFDDEVTFSPTAREKGKEEGAAEPHAQVAVKEQHHG